MKWMMWLRRLGHEESCCALPGSQICILCASMHLLQFDPCDTCSEFPQGQHQLIPAPDVPSVAKQFEGAPQPPCTPSMFCKPHMPCIMHPIASHCMPNISRSSHMPCAPNISRSSHMPCAPNMSCSSHMQCTPSMLSHAPEHVTVLPHAMHAQQPLVMPIKPDVVL